MLPSFPPRLKPHEGPEGACALRVACAFLVMLPILAAGCKKTDKKPAEQEPQAQKPPAKVSADQFAKSLAEQLERIRTDGSQSPQTRRRAVQLQGGLDWIRHTWGNNEANRLERLNALQEDLFRVTQGRAPLHNPGTSVVRAYSSPIDDTRQHYSVGIPSDFKPGKSYPMYLVLHGQGAFSRFQGIPVRRYEDAITVGPHGRGGMDYQYVSEPDVLRVIEEVCLDYNVDNRRIYVVGGSMGGTGAWHLATRFPDLFAGLCSLCGNADISVWQREWEWKNPENSPLNPVRQFMRMDTSAVSYAENLLHVPSIAYHGTSDDIVMVGHSRSMTSRIRELGYDNCYYIEIPYAGHGIGVKMEETVRHCERPLRPKRVVFKTAWLRYPGAFWVGVDSIERGLHYARVDARIEDERRIVATTRHVTRLHFDLSEAPVARKTELTCILDGQTVWRGTYPDTRRPEFWKSRQGQWLFGPPPNPGWPPQKRRDLEGPIENAFMSRFLLVYGTTGKTEEDRQAVERAAREFHSVWAQRYGGGCRMKADRDLAETDILDSNLIIYGNPEQNALAARVVNGDLELSREAPTRRLPVRFEQDSIVFCGVKYAGRDVGIKMCYPNPLNPDRYCVLMAGVTARALHQINTRFGNWFDWVPFDYRNWYDFAVFDDRTSGYYPETMLTVGFFDENWQPRPELTWAACPRFRRMVLPRKIPPFKEVPVDKDTVYLDDVTPASAYKLKGFVAFNQEQTGRQMYPGGMIVPKGLNARIPATIEYDIKGEFKRFRAVAGIDWPQYVECPRARAEKEFVSFRVYGDNRLLWEAKGLTWKSDPVMVDLCVEGVKRLKLATSGGVFWLNGSATWGYARVEK